MQPRFVTLGELRLIGACCHHSFFAEGRVSAFAETWVRFETWREEIRRTIDPGRLYGVQFYSSEAPTRRDLGPAWSYFAGVQVSKIKDVPLPFVGKTLPACDYAVFSQQGSVHELPGLFHHIHRDWLPSSPYRQSHPYEFECYEDGRFFGAHHAGSEIDIYVPVTR